MRIIWIILLTLPGLRQGFAQAIGPAAMRAAIDVNRLEHPYLLFGTAEKVQMLQRIQTDPESHDIMASIQAEADMFLIHPVDPEIPARPTHVRAGWTEADRENAYGKKLRKYRHMALTLAFVYQMTGEAAYAQKAYAFAEQVCRMPLWTLQAHEFDIIYSRVWPWNVEDDQTNFNFDIGSATTGQIIAWVYDWTYQALEKRQRDRLRGALLEKAITPVRGDYDLHWWASSYRCNWTGVCNAGLGMVALALLKEHPGLIDVVAESYNRIYLMMNELGLDGGWQEGGSYWRYGMDRSALFAYALKRASGGQYSLFQHERFQANPMTFPIYLFVPPNQAVNFGDAHERAIGGTDFFNLLTNETQNPAGAWYRQNVLGAGDDIFDLVFPRPAVAPSAPETGSIHFRTIDWWVMRSDFEDPNKVTLAGKAGKNDDPHHGHLDIGHFILYWRGIDYLKDSGRPYYDEVYFDEARWQYPQAASSGHNVVIVNGEEQIPGKRKDQPFDFRIGGEVITFETTPERDYVLMDPTNAYPGQELSQWRRHVTLEKPHITLVLDEVKATSAQPEIQLRFHSGAEVNLRDDMALLQDEKGIMALIPLSEDAVKLQLGKHPYQPNHGTKKFQWLPYFDLVLNPEANQTTVANLILPVESIQEAPAIRTTLQMDQTPKSLLIQFTYRDKDFQFAFKKGKEGNWVRDE